MSGKLLGSQLEKQIRHGIRRDNQAFHSVNSADTSQAHRKPSAFPTYRVILDVTVDAQADPLGEVEGSIDPTQPNATICLWSARQKRWVQSNKRLAVANASDTEYPVDNIAWAVPQSGIYLLGGCPVEVSNRADPPWLVTLQEEQAPEVTP